MFKTFLYATVRRIFTFKPLDMLSKNCQKDTQFEIGILFQIYEVYKNHNFGVLKKPSVV